MKVEQQQHFCNSCYKSFPSQSYLSSHITACTSTYAAAASHFHPDDQHHHCKECGKRFQSMKALCGHMACHSEKLKVFSHNNQTSNNNNNNNNAHFPDHSWEDNDNGNAAAAADDDDDDHQSVMDSQSDNETVFPTRQRRSRRLRYKHRHHNNAAPHHAVANKYSTNPTTTLLFAATNTDNNNNNGSSSFSGLIDVQDQDGAMCLMMLSRDHSGNWSGFSSFRADSSDNNSIVLEEAAAVAAGANGIGKAGADEKKVLLKSCDSFNSSSSGYFQNGYGDDYESDGWVATGSRWEDENEEDDDLVDHKKRRNKLSECFICYKVFESPQALGGHIASHKKCNDINIASGSSETLSHPNYEISSSSSKYAATKTIKKVKEKKAGWKNGKKYECPVCYKVLKSGQALGGHKRIHNINLFSNATAASNYSEDHHHRKNTYKTMIRNNTAMKHPTSENTDRLIDLNFPPPPT